jgi:nitrite reductase/ring-hydroxylating ferredoxin subunit
VGEGEAGPGEVPVVLVRHDGALYALSAACTRAGVRSAKAGSLRMGAIRGPGHASISRIANGEMVRGPVVIDNPCCEVKASGCVCVRSAASQTKRLIGPCLERTGNGEEIRCWRPCQMELRSRIR